MRRTGLDAVVGLAEGGELVVAVDEDVLASHEVGVFLNTGQTVQEGEHGVQEGLLLLDGTARAELHRESRSQMSKLDDYTQNSENYEPQ